MISRKVALVTGASAGFGAAIVTNLVSDGYSVIGCARRMDKLKCLGEKFSEGHFYPLQMDITS
ncbi:TPA: SDR family NAD(P)-dependent oxidoreductase, partial [Streptococcus agalactiae]